MTRRRSGLLVPLFSAPSSKSWGIGDIGDLPALTAWLSGAGQRVLQVLPLNEMAAGQQSPYTAISAMAIDPIFIQVPAVEDWVAGGGVASLSAEDREALKWVRSSPRLEYSTIRRLKEAALATAFNRFYDHEWSHETARARALRDFVSAEAWWLDDYALFRTIRVREHGHPWTEWSEPLRSRHADALAQVRRRFGREVLFYQYLQWIAGSQWAQATAEAHAHGVKLYGDLPFMVDADSADVWTHQQCFRLDVSVGAPPDAFSATGQDWGMPLYDWDAMAREDFRWLRDRARRNSHLYDGYRVDHLVGFYRTFGRPRAGGEPFFTPAREPEQAALGVRVLTLFRESGADIIAEDLGTVPDFVRESLADLKVPGFRVLRWERRWLEEDQPFRDPADYPANSVATSGTHDTEPMKVWWEQAPDEERTQLSRLPTVQRVTEGQGLLNRPYDLSVSAALLEALFAAASDLLLLPVQDVFGWTDRINEPATVTPDNWTFRLPWLVDCLDTVPSARDVQARLHALADQTVESDIIQGSMATLVPFRALRPRPAEAAQIAAVPYDVVNTDEARALADGNPLSFLRVSRAEIELPPATDPYSDAVYQRAADNFARLKAAMIVEAEPSVYFYRLRMGAHEQTGIAACYSLDEYDRDVIKKHERTRRDKEDDRTGHLVALGAQTGPVFLTYKAAPDVTAVRERALDEQPLIDFEAVDGVRHTLWRVSTANRDELVRAFQQIPALYIADGHHRAASAARARGALGQRAASLGDGADVNTVLAVAFPHDQVQILAYNRLVKDLAGKTPEAFLDLVRRVFAVEAGPTEPKSRGDVAMYLQGTWYTLRPSVAPDARDPIRSLDVSVLQDRLLAPMLGIADVRTDKRIDFVGGARGTGALQQAVDSGRAAVAFSLYPVSVSDLMAVSDANEIMPPKSTWFEPKLRDGLLIHMI